MATSNLYLGGYLSINLKKYGMRDPYIRGTIKLNPKFDCKTNFIVECSDQCRCSLMCPNRVVQVGIGNIIKS